MKKVSRRALFALALAVVLAVGTLAFCVKYAANAENGSRFPAVRTSIPARISPAAKFTTAPACAF